MTINHFIPLTDSDDGDEISNNPTSQVEASEKDGEHSLTLSSQAEDALSAAEDDARSGEAVLADF